MDGRTLPRLVRPSHHIRLRGAKVRPLIRFVKAGFVAPAQGTTGPASVSPLAMRLAAAVATPGRQDQLIPAAKRKILLINHPATAS